ncbi:MAG: SCP2 domain-containing protein, partial [Gammaproteobacteria bacterium]
EEPPHTVLKGTPLTLLKMVMETEQAQRFPEELEIAGDVETARRFQSLLGGLEIDWEEQLSRIVGDVAAHQAGNALRTLHRWCRQAGAHLEQDTVEYLREEKDLLPYRDEMEDFLAAVDVLRDDTERLALRVERLQQRLAGQTAVRRDGEGA